MKKHYLLFLIAIGFVYIWNRDRVFKLIFEEPTIKVSRRSANDESTATNTKKSATSSSRSQQARLPAQAAPGSFKDNSPLSKLQKFTNCRIQENCPYPQTDPKSYLLALNKDVASLAASLSPTQVLAERALLEELRQWMMEGDGFTQEKILDVFADLPPSPENLEAILIGVENNYADPLIFEQAMNEFSRYPDSQNKINQFLSRTLIEGPQLTATTAAKTLRKYLNQENFNHFKKTVGKVRSEVVRESLSSSLRDYQRSLTGA